MARPLKNGCDYFSHDSGMRNHRKIKALRNKFNNGYAIWCMLLEYLTESEGNEIKNEEVEMELIAGDFGFLTSEISQVVGYCIQIGLLNESNGFINSENLKERLAPVYTKRDKFRSRAMGQKRKNGVFDSNNTVNETLLTSVIPKKETLLTSESTQSKVNKSKLNTTVGGVKTPRKKKLNPESELYWKSLVSVYFSFCVEKFGEKPSFDGSSPSDMHRIIEQLKVRAIEKEIAWTEDIAKKWWKHFLTKAYQNKWLSEHWLLSNLNRQKDVIILNEGKEIATNGNSYQQEVNEKIKNYKLVT